MAVAAAPMGRGRGTVMAVSDEEPDAIGIAAICAGVIVFVGPRRVSGLRADTNLRLGAGNIALRQPAFGHCIGGRQDGHCAGT